MQQTTKKEQMVICKHLPPKLRKTQIIFKPLLLQIHFLKTKTKHKNQLPILQIQIYKKINTYIPKKEKTAKYVIRSMAWLI